MNPNLLATFARGAMPGQPPPTMLPPGMPMPGMPMAGPGGAHSASPMPPGPMPSGMPPPGMPQQGPPAARPGPQAGASATLPPGVGGPPIDASRVIRQVGNPRGGNPRGTAPAMARAADAGRGGDSIMAHLSPGETVVPPEAQTPELLAMLDRAFAQMGADPASFVAGHPNQKINPETGAPEFFLPMILPMALSLAGSTFLGPAIGTALGISAAAGGLTGAIPGVLGGALGGIAGNLITGKPLGESLARGALGGVGSAIGGQLLGGGGSLFGGGPTPMAEVGPGAGLASDAIRNPFDLADLPGGGLSQTGWPLTTEAGIAGAAEAAKPSFFDQLISKQSIGSGIGGLLAGSVADSLFAGAGPESGNTDTPIPPPGSGWPLVGGNQTTPSFPGAEYLKDYGRRPRFNFFPAA